jgi:hypothetical protein
MKKLRVALVGWEDKPEDEEAWTRIRADLKARVPSLDHSDDQLDSAILNNPLTREGDFLRNAASFDIVVLCRIFDPGPRATAADLSELSPRHSPANWRTRLVATGAAHIYVWGSEESDASICVEYLGRLDGYETIKINDSLIPLALYRRVTPDA